MVRFIQRASQGLLPCKIMMTDWRIRLWKPAFGEQCVPFKLCRNEKLLAIGHHLYFFLLLQGVQGRKASLLILPQKLRSLVQ